MHERRERWIPTGYEKIHEDENCVVYASFANRWPTAIGYHGRAFNRDFYNTFENREELERKVAEYVEGWKRRAAYKAEQRAKPRILSGHAAAAAAIRAELKNTFPGTSFRVRSSCFAGGDDVVVSWTDGPLAFPVEKILDKYQYGHFDGMIDLYEDSNVRKDIPQVKYVNTNRELSMARAVELATEYEARKGWKIVITDKGDFWTAEWATNEAIERHNHHSPRGELLYFELEEDMAKETVASDRLVS
ncbi:MAG TPA: hypothetical protein P5142_00290 [Spirochaetia bacterium]|nr:hypothetical protein [Spirochaetia bacterium]